MVTNSLKNTDKEGQTGLCYGLLAPSEQAQPLRWGGICRFNPLYSWNNLQLTFYSFLSQSEFLGQCSDGGCSTPISLCWPGISKISSVKGETAVNTFCFVSHTVSVTTTQLSAVCSTKAARAIGKWMEGAVFWFSLIYKNRVQAIWPTGYYFADLWSPLHLPLFTSEWEQSTFSFKERASALLVFCLNFSSLERKRN